MLEEIEKAQRDVRKGKSKQIIDAIGKSKQRSRGFLKNLRNLDPEDIDDLF